MDKEFIVLDTISSNSEITQRELSKKTGLSLGSINILLTKMVKDGLIKVKQIPANRALYMLTPKGIAEKIDKTYNYIKIHYNFINETKDKIRIVLKELEKTETDLVIFIENDEISELIKSVLGQFPSITITNCINSCDKEKVIIVTCSERFDELSSKGYKLVNIIEKL